MDRISAPFTPEEVRELNDHQQKGSFHPFTCCSPEYVDGCTRKNKTGKSIMLDEGTLVATTEGWVCPCGGYVQNWAYRFMIKK